MLSKEPTLKQQIERLERLLKLDEQLTEHEKTKHFNMRAWQQETPCGTSCCLAGYAGRQSWFRRRGFKMTGTKGGAWWPVYKEYTGVFACDAFFGRGSIGELFDGVYPDDWQAAMRRVQRRLNRLRGIKSTEDNLE